MRQKKVRFFTLFSRQKSTVETANDLKSNYKVKRQGVWSSFTHVFLVYLWDLCVPYAIDL
jgi:hypothetical protein